MLSAKQVIRLTAAGLLVTSAVSTLDFGVANAQQPSSAGRIGAVYELRRDVQSTQNSSDGSRSSSRDQDALLERVIGIRGDGLELEYDLPKDTTEQDRALAWQFPVRVFSSTGGSQLLNESELSVRVDNWLKRAGVTRAACGHWAFTWNAVQVECDPRSALQAIRAFDLGFDDLHDGAVYADPQASASTTLKRAAVSPEGATLTGEMLVDPESVRRDEAQSDVVIAEIMKQPLTLDDAIRARSSEKVSGTISVTFDTDPAGFVRRRTKLLKVETTSSTGLTEHRTVIETVERRVVSSVPSEPRP